MRSWAGVMEVNLTRWESLGADLNLAALRQDTRRLDHYPTDVVSPSVPVATRGRAPLTTHVSV